MKKVANCLLKPALHQQNVANHIDGRGPRTWNTKLKLSGPGGVLGFLVQNPRLALQNFKFTRVYQESRKVVVGSTGYDSVLFALYMLSKPTSFCSTWAQCSSMVSGRTDWFRSTFAKLKSIEQGSVQATIEPASDPAHVWRQCWPAVYLSVICSTRLWDDTWPFTCLRQRPAIELALEVHFWCWFVMYLWFLMDRQAFNPIHWMQLMVTKMQLIHWGLRAQLISTGGPQQTLLWDAMTDRACSKKDHFAFNKIQCPWRCCHTSNLTRLGRKNGTPRYKRSMIKQKPRNHQLLHAILHLTNQQLLYAKKQLTWRPWFACCSIRHHKVCLPDASLSDISPRPRECNRM